MADFTNIALSVGVTLTLQSIYLAGIKFQRILREESNALQNTARLLQENLAEGSAAIDAARDAQTKCAEAYDFLVGNAEGIDRQDLIWDLTILGAKLEGLSSCREPDATYVRNGAKGVQRTIAMLLDGSMSEGRMRLEAMAIAQEGHASLKATAYRVNEERLKIADGLEQRSTSLDCSLLEFWGASASCYLGVLGISAWIFFESNIFPSTHLWARILLWLFVAGLMGPVMVFLRNVGDAAQKVIDATNLQVANMRDQLIRLE